MASPENILEVAGLRPEFMGFIFWEKSPRFFDGTIPEIPKNILKVGVFVNETIANILGKVQEHDLDFVQLHGQESPEYCAALQSENIKIIKVFSIGNAFDFDFLKPYEPYCDSFLFDTKGKMPGGNGITFDWQILKKYNSKKPLFLSGGIGIETIAAIKNLKLPIYAIDVNSKFETQPGIKNAELLKQFQSQLYELSR